MIIVTITNTAPENIEGPFCVSTEIVLQSKVSDFERFKASRMQYYIPREA